jgi:methanogenic corrinoid protein MtbC1
MATPEQNMLNSAALSIAKHAPPVNLAGLADAACTGSLRSLITSQIIPRLLEAHPRADLGNTVFPDAGYQPDEADVTAFARLCVSHESDEVLAFVEKLMLDNVDSNSLYLRLIAPAARHLGWMWDNELTDFTQVTMGLLRMHQITHRIGYEYQTGPDKPGPTRRVMLACAPGSQHILGLAIVSEFFRKEGWQVVVEIANTPAELYQAARNEWFDLIGLSVGIHEQFKGLRKLINGLKDMSRNPDVPVLLGGPVFLGGNTSAESLGADAIATDALDGVQLAGLLAPS